jgi:hypothetical protein
MIPISMQVELAYEKIPGAVRGDRRAARLKTSSMVSDKASARHRETRVPPEPQ